MSEYRVCSRCVMDTTDPEITFDSSGVCSHCSMYDRVSRERYFPDERGRRQLQTTVETMKRRGAASDYDAVIGISGGVDSTYAAYIASGFGLRLLAVHLDSGWNSELAVKNIESLLTSLKIDLYTHVVDWEEMRDLQLAFLRSGVANCDIPTDHAIFAALYQAAERHNIPYLIVGTNIPTETILPRAWGYTSSDLVHLKAIQRRFGSLPLKQYPQLSFRSRFIWHRFFDKIEQVRILDYIPYVKKDAMRLLEEKFDWRYYGGKHYESQFTKFFQGYYLPKRFGFDKRRAHLSSLVVSGQMSREQAMAELAAPACTPEEAADLVEYVAKKLGITGAELEAIVAAPPADFRSYPNMDVIFRVAEKVKAAVSRVA